MNLTEDSLIAALKTRFQVPSPLVGIGDDCAIIPQGEYGELLTTDALIEGVHFLKSTLSSKDLGYKSIMVNVSDIAAMGGTPLYALLSMGLPREISPDFLPSFLEGIEEALRATHVHLIGGDTVASLQHIFINITIVGRVKLKEVKRREGAKPGDILCVDGYLGNSAAGLADLLKGAKSSSVVLEAHQRPRAHVGEGCWLAQSEQVHAMMDLSDGLAMDLPRLLEASKCSARIDLEKLPISSALSDWCKRTQKNPYSMAVEGGEDYCLLFAVAPGHLEKLKYAFQKQFGRPIFPIGQLRAPADCKVRYFLDGVACDLEVNPFQHF